MSNESLDGPLIDKYENTPEEMRRTVKETVKSNQKVNNLMIRRKESTDEISDMQPTMNEDELQVKKRKNFVTACEYVSKKAYYDKCSRLLLSKLPQCVKESACKHRENNYGDSIKQMPGYTEELFKIEINTNMWLEALQVCNMCITPTQYLSASVLKNIVEIMLNAHEDDNGDYTINFLLNKCEETLIKNFTIHPPCIIRKLRKCYRDFLTSPMDLRDKTFTNRVKFGHDQGIVKYCFNRLENEMSNESLDGPLIDKYENTPEEMRRTVKGMHWQKEKFEIFELLERHDRIERLMSVLKSIIILLQLDLAIWHSRYTNNLGSHIMRAHKPLMALILWSDNVLYTGAVNNNCRQIIRIFVHMVHLQYPENHIKIMVTWLNTIIQTFYICETDSNSDYPNVAKYSKTFASEFCKIIAEIPQESVVKSLQIIKPSFMRMLIGTQHIKTLLPTKEDCIVKILIQFVKEEHWKQFTELDTEVHITKHFFLPVKIDENLFYPSETYTKYPKLNLESLHHSTEISLNYIVQILYITLEAYLAAYNVQRVQEKLDSLNDTLKNENDKELDNLIPGDYYYVSEQFIKKYVNIFKMLKELVIKFQTKTMSDLPQIMTIFKNVGLLDL